MQGASFAVLGLGKLGSREMTFDSDLDVVFVYGAPDGVDAQSDGALGLAASHYFARFSQRLTHALSAHTAEGRLYEIDTRLRPSGSSGPIATEASAFRRYHEQDAWTWEHMALTRARPVAGDRELCATVMEGIRAVLCAPRDPDTLLADVASMRERVDNERKTENRWRLKHVRGGVLDLEFIAQYHLLRHAARHPSILVQSTPSAFRRLGEAGILDSDDAAELADSAAFLQRLQGLLRLTVGHNRDVERFTPGVRETLARAMAMEDFSALERGSFSTLEKAIRKSRRRRSGSRPRRLSTPHRGPRRGAQQGMKDTEETRHEHDDRCRHRARRRDSRQGAGDQRWRLAHASSKTCAARLPKSCSRLSILPRSPDDTPGCTREAQEFTEALPEFATAL